MQLSKRGSILSDMYSFGMVICAIFNYGRPLIQANHNCSEYSRQLDTVRVEIIQIIYIVTSIVIIYIIDILVGRASA